MKRMIDAQDAFNVLTDYYHHKSSTQHLALQEALNKVPTADAEPVRHGKWIYTRYYTWECSECKKNPTSGMGYVQSKDELFDFCPHCGADMRGEK